VVGRKYEAKPLWRGISGAALVVFGGGNILFFECLGIIVKFI
jgi:hypothetical protein